MQSFKDWVYARNKTYYESFVFSEQGNLPVVLPRPIEYPQGSGRRFWQIKNPDNPSETINIQTTSPDAEERAMDLVRRNAQINKTSQQQTGNVQQGQGQTNTNDASSLINPTIKNKNNVTVNGNDMTLASRNVMVKRFISDRKNKPFAAITDAEADVELAYLANEDGEKEFVKMNGTKTDLKKIQQDFVDRYGINPEMQMINGATKEMTRLSPKDWTGITIKQGRIASRQPMPKGATVIPFRPAGKPVIAPAEKGQRDRDKLLLQRAYGDDTSKWQRSAQVAAGLIEDPMLNDESFYFMKFLNDYGADYSKWSQQQQKAAGIDLNIPYYSPDSLKPMDSSKPTTQQPQLNNEKIDEITKRMNIKADELEKAVKGNDNELVIRLTTELEKMTQEYYSAGGK